MIHAWLAWAARSRIAAFVELGRRIRRNLPGIEAAMCRNLSNALIESTNTKLRVLHRMAFGFKKPEHLVALALLDRAATAHHYPAGKRPDGPTDTSGEFPIADDEKSREGNAKAFA